MFARSSAVFTSILMTGFLLGCGDDASEVKPTVRSGTTQVVDSGCPGRLEPLPISEANEVVGTGSPESCTEAALVAALTTVSARADGGSITFDCGTDAHTITLSQSLEVTGKLLIDGEGRIMLSGGNRTRILNLDHESELSIQRIVLRDGRTKESGAAIYHPWYGTLTAIDVDFENNHCTDEVGELGGGAVFAGGLRQATFSGCRFVGNSASNGGGLLNRGSTLTVVDSVFEQNEATSYAVSGQYGNGGGLYIDGMDYDATGDFHLCGTIFRGNHAKQHGSAVFSYFYAGSTAYIDRCHFDANDFENSPGGGAGGLYHEAVPLYLSNSTFSNNRSGQHAAGLFLGSGSEATVTNCTFVKNQVPEVGAALFSGSSPVSLVNCTFAENEADYAPAIFKGETNEISLKNSVFWQNSTPNQYSALACHETLIDEGGNLQWPETKTNGAADQPCASGIRFADAALGTLGAGGEYPPVLRPAATSPALALGTGCPDTDALGTLRGNPCDSGAVELATP